MKFKVIIRDITGGNLSANLAKPGLDVLDQIREHYNLPNLHPEIVNNTVQRKIFSHDESSVEITESVARKSGLFKETNIITVYVSQEIEKNLITFCFNDIRDDNDGIVEVRINWYLLKNRFYGLWCADNYPEILK